MVNDLTPNLRQEIGKKLGEVSVDLTAAVNTITHIGHTDLFELCSTEKSILAEWVLQRGGRVLRMGLWSNYDIAKSWTVERAKTDVFRQRPRHLHASPPCTPFSLLQNANQNTEAQREKLAKQRRWGKKVIRNVIDVLTFAFRRKCAVSC